MLQVLDTAAVSCATMTLQLLDHPAVLLEPGVLLLELFLYSTVAGLCIIHLMPLLLLLASGLPRFLILNFAVCHQVCSRKILRLNQRLRPVSCTAFYRSTYSNALSQ